MPNYEMLLKHSLKFAPLKRAEENDLILEAQNGNHKSQEIVFNHNYRLVFYLLFKHLSGLTFYFTVTKKVQGGWVKLNQDEVEEMISLMTIKLCEVIKKFNVKAGYRFQTYANTALYHEMIDYTKSVTKQRLRHHDFTEQIFNIPSDFSFDTPEIEQEIKKKFDDLSPLMQSVLIDKQDGYSKKQIMTRNELTEYQYRTILDGIKVNFLYLLDGYIIKNKQ